MNDQRAPHFYERILSFLSELNISEKLPKGVVILNPYQNEEVFRLCGQFYKKYYEDMCDRQIIVGINPGRFGGGLTGIPFTDPVKLKDDCNIENDLPKKVELSADFIYSIIDAYGGPKKFYSRYYFSSVSPLGFVKDGKNLNYYDIAKLQEALLPFIVSSFRKQISLGIGTKRCIVLGEGKNYHFLKKLNEEYRFFNELIPLPHPRFIMQYRRKRLKEFTEIYLNVLT